MNALYYFFYAIWYLCSLLPMRVHYVFSDFVVYPLVFHLLKYRRALVRKNLADCFPEKSDAERAKIESDFYHWFSDYVVETIKEMSISQQEMMRRMTFENFDLLDQHFSESGKNNCFIYLGHFGNWEWVASIPYWSRSDAAFAQIYHPLHSDVMDKLFLKLRSRFGAHNIAMKETLRAMLNYKREGRRAMVGFISDQSPKIEAMHHWTTFLHHETSFFTGAEKIGQKVGAVYYYLDVTRPHRGHYHAVLRELKPADSDSPFPITDAFAAVLEESIKSHPHLWLWTHNRWKRTREHWERYHAERQKGA